MSAQSPATPKTTLRSSPAAFLYSSSSRTSRSRRLTPVRSRTSCGACRVAVRQYSAELSAKPLSATAWAAKKALARETSSMKKMVVGLFISANAFLFQLTAWPTGKRRSIPPPAIDCSGNMFTPGSGADFFGQLPDGLFLGGESRQMRGQRDFRVFSERMSGRQGLGAVNVQHGGRQPAAVQTGQQVVRHHVRTAASVDETGVGQQAGGGVAGEDVFGLRGQRRDVDEHAAGGQKAIDPFIAGKALDALNILGRTAPAVDRKAEKSQRAGNLLPQRAPSHDALWEIVARLVPELVPAAGPHGFFVVVQITVVPDDGLHHILGHQRAHAGILDAGDGHVGGDVHFEQRIHAGAQVEHRFQAGLLFKQLRRRIPYQRIVGRRGTRRPYFNLSLGQGTGHGAAPGLGVHFLVSGAKKYSHDRRSADLMLASIVI